uniref:SH3 domain-containing protein n=1 Tax=Emiliania huxleyi TaxID=2903 RepID=A0A6U8RM94_EMIHU
MGAEESTMGGGGGGGRKQQQPRFDVVKLRVVAYTVPVTHDVEPASEEICRLPRGTVVEAVEEKASRNGTVRVLITDPIWKGWISLRAPNGELDLEPTDAAQAEKLMARSGAAALQGPPLREPEAQAALVAELQAESFCIGAA